MGVVLVVAISVYSRLSGVPIYRVRRNVDFMKHNNQQTAFTLLELLVTITLLGIVAAVIVTRVTGGSDDAEIAACHVYKGDIEIQAELWIHNRGSWPASNLAAIGADINYFPEGLPVCPVDGTGYTIDASGLVTGHTH